ncbi:MAG: NAD-dependent deacylase [bacterium]|nr:NAD-dependent deacylase [bacterium]
MADTKIKVNDYKHIVILTGAGISVASGIAPFRGPGGLWTDHDIERCATARALRRTPEVVWDAFKPVREGANTHKPNATHYALAELEAKHPDVTILTQNIDGLHQKAGSKNVIELHGSMKRSRCTHCNREPFEDEDCTYRMCDRCGKPLRYDIVLFEENLDPAVIEASYYALSKVDLFIALGTSGIVYPAAGFASDAKRNRARTVLVNLEDLRSPLYDDVLIGKAEEITPNLFVY